MPAITFTQEQIPETMKRFSRILVTEGMVKHMRALFDEAARWKKECADSTIDHHIRCVLSQTPDETILDETILDETSSHAAYYCDEAHRRLDAPSLNGMTPLTA